MVTDVDLKNVERADVDKLPGEYREILIHLLLASAVGELGAGDRYASEFYEMAPTAREKYLCLKFGSEEVDHFVKIGNVLAEFDVGIDYLARKPMSEREFYPAESMTVEYHNWEERSAFSFLCEYEGHVQLTDLAQSGYRPLAKVSTQILKEEAGHFGHGSLLMRRAAENPDTKETAQAALDRFWPLALDMFGRTESSRSRKTVEWQIRPHSNGELRDIFRVEIGEHIEKLGYSIPKDDPALRNFL